MFRTNIAAAILFASITGAASQPGPVLPNQSDRPARLQAEERKRALERYNAQIKQMTAELDEARRKNGFPPESDLVGTVTQCEKLTDQSFAGAQQCTVEWARRFATNTTESADTVAEAVVGRCAPHFSGPYLAYCVSPNGSAREIAEERYRRNMKAAVLWYIIGQRTNPGTEADGAAPRP